MIYHTSDPACELLSVLVQGGGSELYLFEKIVAVEVQSVGIAPGSFVRHLGEDLIPDACLALVSHMVKLCAEDDYGERQRVICGSFLEVSPSHPDLT